MSENLSLVIEIDRGAVFEELPISVRAGDWPLAHISAQGVLVIHPEPESQACEDFLLAAVQREVSRRGQVMWVMWSRRPDSSSRVEANAIYHEAESPVTRLEAAIMEELFGK